MTENNGFFSPEEMEILGSFGAKKLQAVHFMFWINKTEEAPLFLIDAIILGFEGDVVLQLEVNETGDGVRIGDKDYEQEQLALEAEFDGKMGYERVDAGKAEGWETYIGSQMVRVNLMTEDGTSFKNEGLIFEFEDGRIGISAQGDELKTIELTDRDEGI